MRLTDTERRVLETITERDVVEVTRRLVRCTGTNPPGGEKATVQEFASICREFGLPCETTVVTGDRPNVSARLPAVERGAGPGLLLLGHTDVVPVGPGWTRDPFGGELDGGRLYGRGSSDMKGGLAAGLVALRALARAEVRLTGPVELVATVDEEETGLGVRHWIADPAALPPLVGCIVAEPTELQTIIAARGDSTLDVTVHGRAAHAGNPDDGRNAIHGAAAIVSEIQRWNDEFASKPTRFGGLVGASTFNVGLVDGGQATATVAAHCHLSIDRRLMPDEDPAAVLADVRGRIDALDLAAADLTVEVDMLMDMPGFASDPDDPFVRCVDGALGAAGGPGRALGGWTAACDGGFVARATGCPVVVLGPGSVTEQAHRVDESVGVDELLVAGRSYALAALRLLGEAG